MPSGIQAQGVPAYRRSQRCKQVRIELRERQSSPPDRADGEERLVPGEHQTHLLAGGRPQLNAGISA